jgi:hypothetical protein
LKNFQKSKLSNLRVDMQIHQQYRTIRFEGSQLIKISGILQPEVSKFSYLCKICNSKNMSLPRAFCKNNMFELTNQRFFATENLDFTKHYEIATEVSEKRKPKNLRSFGQKLITVHSYNISYEIVET